MKQKIDNLDIFKFRQDNRQKGIDRNHVEKLKRSINSHNMLELKPILINKNFEIIDGQHRVTAAKELGLAIWYEIDQTEDPKTIILMNMQKSWTMGDFYNFYIQHRYPQYLLLEEFMKKNEIPLNIAVTLINGKDHEKLHQFKNGDFVFKQDYLSEEIDNCWETINYIKRILGGAVISRFCTTHRFWLALTRLVKHRDFNMASWMRNLEKNIDLISVKTCTEDYCKMLMRIYNYRKRVDIDILEEQNYD